MSVIEYIPVCGLTIREALNNAKALARKNNKTVIANINDIIMCVSSTSTIKDTLDLYHKKLDLKYEIEKMKHEKQK